MSDVAVLAGCSRSTVSVVLNGRHNDIGIAEETRLKILSAAQELGYRRNELARAVKTGRSHTIGFLAGTIHLEYSARIFAGAVDEAENHGYSVQRFRIEGKGQDKNTLIRCVEHRLAGVLVYDPDCHLPLEMMRREFENHALHAVLLDVKTPVEWGRGVASDDERGARDAVRHLIQLGHERIVFLGGIENSGTSVPRFAGYWAAMGEAGLGHRARAIWTNWQTELEEERLLELLTQATPPTAILCGSDPQALIAIRLVRSLGKDVPHDVSIVGFGDLLRTELADPPLSTISVPYEAMGASAIRLLLDSARREENHWSQTVAQTLMMSTNLVLRRSTAPLRG